MCGDKGGNGQERLARCSTSTRSGSRPSATGCGAGARIDWADVAENARLYRELVLLTMQRGDEARAAPRGRRWGPTRGRRGRARAAAGGGSCSPRDDGSHTEGAEQREMRAACSRPRSPAAPRSIPSRCVSSCWTATGWISRRPSKAGSRGSATAARCPNCRRRSRISPRVYQPPPTRMADSISLLRRQCRSKLARAHRGEPGLRRRIPGSLMGPGLARCKGPWGDDRRLIGEPAQADRSPILRLQRGSGRGELDFWGCRDCI